MVKTPCGFCATKRYGKAVERMYYYVSLVLFAVGMVAVVLVAMTWS